MDCAQSNKSFCFGMVYSTLCNYNISGIECLRQRGCTGRFLSSKNNNIQSNLNNSNTDGSFTMANSNSFLSPYEILPIDQENNFLTKLSYFIMKLYVVCTH